jgi:hypothetical protein
MQNLVGKQAGKASNLVANEHIWLSSRERCLMENVVASKASSHTLAVLCLLSLMQHMDPQDLMAEDLVGQI